MDMSVCRPTFRCVRRSEEDGREEVQRHRRGVQRTVGRKEEGSLWQWAGPGWKRHGRIWQWVFLLLSPSSLSLSSSVMGKHWNPARANQPEPGFDNWTEPKVLRTRTDQNPDHQRTPTEHEYKICVLCHLQLSSPLTSKGVIYGFFLEFLQEQVSPLSVWRSVWACTTGKGKVTWLVWLEHRQVSPLTVWRSVCACTTGKRNVTWLVWLEHTQAAPLPWTCRWSVVNATTRTTITFPACASIKLVLLGDRDAYKYNKDLRSETGQPLCVNSLSKAAAKCAAAKSPVCDMLITCPAPYHYALEPQVGKTGKRCGNLIVQLNWVKRKFAISGLTGEERGLGRLKLEQR